MTKRRLVIYDDEPRIVAGWKRSLGRLPAVAKDFEIVEIGKEEFEEAISELEDRRARARLKSGRSSPTTSNTLDTASVLILDFDLLDSSGPFYLTGENVAYLARCYSRCGLIIGLNQFGENAFDLTLKGHPESYADLNIGGRQLANTGLWGEPWLGFRPWMWPVVPRALEAFERRTSDLMKHLNDRVLEFLGFPDDMAKILPRAAAEFLQGEKAAEETTFREFVTLSPSGLRRKDEPMDSESVARVAAARIAKWLERLVLPDQDILVDAPHLVSRFPSLLRGDIRKLEAWNKCTSLGDAAKLGIDHRKIASFAFGRPHWLSRPSWFWLPLSNYEKVEEVASPWAGEQTDSVFCEDISRFLPRAATREFVADLPSPFVRRFVVNPQSKAGRQFARYLRGVDYRPLVRFSL
jgi:hypothetical protein